MSSAAALTLRILGPAKHHVNSHTRPGIAEMPLCLLSPPTTKKYKKAPTENVTACVNLSPGRDERNAMNYADTLKRLVEDGPYTYAEIAEELGTQAPSVSRSLNSGSMRVERLIAIAGMLGYQVALLPAYKALPKGSHRLEM